MPGGVAAAHHRRNRKQDGESGMATFPKGAVLVFGGSGGIGQGVARTFAEAGADVAIVYGATKALAERVAGGIDELGRKVEMPATDVTDDEQVKAKGDRKNVVSGRMGSGLLGRGGRRSI